MKANETHLTRLPPSEKALEFSPPGALNAEECESFRAFESGSSEMLSFVASFLNPFSEAIAISQ